MSLQDTISSLPGFGPKTALKFQSLGLSSVQDVLLYFPFRYDDFSSKSILELSDGEKVLLSGEVVTPASVQYYGFKRNRLRFSIRTDEVVISVSFFNQPYLADKVDVGQQIAIWGKWNKAKATLTGMKILNQSKEDFQPVYRSSEGIKQSSILKLVKTVFEMGYLNLMAENLPNSLLEKYQLMNRQRAIYYMHFPSDDLAYQQAIRRIKFEELLSFQLGLQLLRSKNREKNSGLLINVDRVAIEKKIAALPFSLTHGQSRSLSEILEDMASSRHMNRLLQGDVGSGKTVIAGLAMYAAVTAGYQSALMVPTEILAEQHYESLSQLFPEFSIALLTGNMRVAPRRSLLEAIQSGHVDFVIGTHALFQEDVVYNRLGLVITDEQHRFGVNQRRLFRQKGINPDVLMMTATPIPRTLTITAFGDMDVSIIDQLPQGRKPIITRWVKHEQFPVVLDWLGKEIRKGNQAYIVSPLIEESEALDLKNAVALEAELQAFFKGHVRIGLLHGQMKSDEKESIMLSFKQKALDLLVSTTVIEVGVNVPNATIMLIMDADRFGLSQLHQLRGRVGRGDKQSYAILVANPKTDSGKERMQIMTETNNGFVLAEKDLEMRGAGEIFGTRQSGIPEFKVANIVEDFAMLEEARKVARQVVSDSAWKKEPEWSNLLNDLDKPMILD
ncbi:ATP-dependent DNA helicase RecG [Streptococcus cameli]